MYFFKFPELTAIDDSLIWSTVLIVCIPHVIFMYLGILKKTMIANVEKYQMPPFIFDVLCVIKMNENVEM